MNKASLFTRIGIFAVFIIQLSHSSVAQAKDPRSPEQIKTTLAELVDKGLVLNISTILKNTSAQEIISNDGNYFLLMLDLMGSLEKDRYSNLHLTIFTVLVDLIRQGLRGSESSSASALRTMYTRGIYDQDLIDDIIAFTLKKNEARTFKAAGQALAILHVMYFSANDLGEVKLQSKEAIDPAISRAIGMRLVSSWSTEDFEKIKPASTLALKISGGTLPKEGWNILTTFANSNWKKLTLEQKQMLVSIIKHYRADDTQSVDLVLAAARQTTAIPLRIAWIEALTLGSSIDPNAQAHIHSLLNNDPHPSVREAAAGSIGRSWGSLADLAKLQAAANKEQDPGTKVSMIAALLEGYGRLQQSGHLETAFRSAAAVFHASNNHFFKRSLLFAFQMNLQIPVELKKELGLDMEFDCVATLGGDLTPSPYFDIWAGE